MQPECMKTCPALEAAEAESAGAKDAWEKALDALDTAVSRADNLESQLAAHTGALQAAAKEIGGYKARAEHADIAVRHNQCRVDVYKKIVVPALEAQVAQAERERDVLAKTLADGANDCPYLTFWQDNDHIPAHDWCECIDTDENGFDCTNYEVDAKTCWLAWAREEVRKSGEEKQ
jgi:hypothetical protein